MEIVWLFVGFLLLMAIGMPIAFAMGLSCLIYIIAALPHVPTIVLAQKISSAGQSFTLVAVPLFILAGRLMNIGGITDSIFDFARAILGFVRGGLGTLMF